MDRERVSRENHVNVDTKANGTQCRAWFCSKEWAGAETPREKGRDEGKGILCDQSQVLCDFALVLASSVENF